MKTINARISLPLLLILIAASFACASPPQTRNILFVMTDGLRWQEVFTGADEALMNKENGGVEKPDALKQVYWRDKPEARREVLMPFFWNVIAKQGQIYGNRTKGSDSRVTNKKNISYPGYSETLCGFADPKIETNDNVSNPNVTVFEWLNKKPAYAGKVAAFGAWEDFTGIFNAGRCGFPVSAGYDPVTSMTMTPRLELLNTLKAEEARHWDEEPFDAITFHTAMEYFKASEPRIFYLSLGETDDWCHDGKYKNYLDAAKRADFYVKTLWELVQSLPAYKDKTTLIFTTDHGRGDAPVEWKKHGEKIKGSECTWMAFLGPDTPARGEMTTGTVTNSQLPATMAALLGEDYNAGVPQAAKPISDAIAR